MIALWQTIVEHLLSWPVAVFLLALVFRKPVTAMIDSIDLLKWKGGAGEVELSRKASQQSEAAKLALQDTLSTSPQGEKQLALPLDGENAQRRAAVIQYGGDFPIVLNQIKDVKAELEKLHFPLNAPETTEAVIRHLAVAQLMYRAEFVYRVIFGSQMAALEKMNIYGPQEPKDLAPLFEAAKRRSPRFYGETTFDEWLDFLRTQDLVVFENGRYGITFYGTNFVEFVNSQKLPRKRH